MRAVPLGAPDRDPPPRPPRRQRGRRQVAPRAARRPPSPDSTRSRRDERAERDAGDPAGEREQQRLGQELDAEVPSRRAERAAEADLRPALEDRDHHDVRDPDAADQERDRAEPEEQRREGALGRGARLDRIRRARDVDLVGVLGVGGDREHGLDVVDVLRVAADGERRDVALVVEVARAPPGSRRAPPCRATGRASPGRGSRSTVKRRLPITTWTPPPARAIPSRRAAVDPRTTAGYRADAASRKTPSASVAPTVTGSDGSTASVVSPFVSVLGISSERKTEASTVPVAETASTGPIRPTIARAGPAAPRPRRRSTARARR